MTTVKRFTQPCVQYGAVNGACRVQEIELFEDVHGKYVLFEDYDKIRQQVFRDVRESDTYNELWHKFARVYDERDQLRRELALANGTVDRLRQEIAALAPDAARWHHITRSHACNWEIWYHNANGSPVYMCCGFDEGKVDTKVDEHIAQITDWAARGAKL
jgi:hypothetical protein